MGFVAEYRNKYQTGGLQHLLATQVRAEVGQDVFASYFKFSFVRDPFDKAASQYEYTRTMRPDLQAYIGMRETDSFKRYLELIQKREHVQWQEQHRFLYDDSGALLVDYVGRFETFESDAAAILGRLGIDCDVPHVNASKRRRTSSYYDAEASEIVGALYRRDIEIFGYAPKTCS